MNWKQQKEFFNGKIKPEFGNIEQINVLKRAEKLHADLLKGIQIGFETGEVDTYNQVLYSSVLDCICGCSIRFEAVSENGELSDILSDINEVCWSCKREYETYTDGLILMVKIVE